MLLKTGDHVQWVKVRRTGKNSLEYTQRDGIVESISEDIVYVKERVSKRTFIMSATRLRHISEKGQLTEALIG